MSDPLYRRELLRLAADAHGAGRLVGANTTGTASNPACGDRVTVDLQLTAGRIEALAQESKACVLTQASASILGTELAGKTRPDVEALRTGLIAMLEGTGDAPFPAYAAFGGVTEHLGRHRCVLLPVDAVLDAFANLERAEPSRKGTER